MSCFACDPEVGPTEPRRSLCVVHKASCELADGTLLQAALSQASPPGGPLEGSLLAQLYNPVFVTDDRGVRRIGFTDFAAGGMAVYEGRSGSDSFFRLWLEGHVGLDNLRELMREANSGVTAIGGLRVKPALTAILEIAVQIWWIGKQVAIRAQALGHWPTSFEDLTSVLRLPSQPPDESAFLSELREIASERVPHGAA